jgi:hypothetical protein
VEMAEWNTLGNRLAEVVGSTPTQSITYCEGATVLN